MKQCEGKQAVTDVSVPGVIGGRYETQRLIGRGGMGSVWLAEDLLLGRLVALKEIAALPGESERETERALREARSAAALNHPNTVALYDAIEHEGIPWLVMEYVSGPTLSEWVREHGPMDPDVAAEVGARLGAGLAAAHRAGVIHRDIKPANVFVADDGEPKLGDFGTARRVAEDRLTLAGVVTGTPSYMAPEVADGGEYTESADVWALGATLYLAVEGEDAYPGTGNALATLRNIATKPPRAPVRAGVLEPVLGQLLSHNPERRGTMREAVRLLEEVAPGRPGAISLIGAGAAGGAGAAAGAAGASAAGRAGEPAAPEDEETNAHFIQDAGDAEEEPEPEGTGLFGFPGAPAPSNGSSRRRGPVIAGVAAAALVTAMGVAAFTIGGGDDREATPTSTSSSTSTPSSTSTSTTSSTTSASETTPETTSETTTEEVVPAPPPTTQAPEPSTTRVPRPAPTTPPRETSSTSESTSETTSETSEPSETSESTTSEPTSSSTSSTSTPDRPSPTSTPDRPSPTSEFTPNPPRPTSGGGSPDRSTSAGSAGSSGTD